MVQIKDEHSGIASGAKLQYGWSTSTTAEPVEWKDITLTGYTAGSTKVTFIAEATEEEKMTGKYYLWVKPVEVKDLAEDGNEQTNTQKSQETYWLDNLAPTITLGVEGNSTWMNNVLVGVKIKDEHSGLVSGAKLVYGWSLSNTEEPKK